jgi:hypothetical protein
MITPSQVRMYQLHYLKQVLQWVQWVTTFEQTIGLVTAGSEIMHNQSSKVARGLRTIGNNFANTAKTADSFTIKVGGVSKTIGLIDEKTGDMKNTYSIFQDISKYWDKMTNSEKQSLAIQFAGKNQFEVFTSVMQNFGHAQTATETAMNSAGSATKENAKYMESLSAKVEKLKAQFQDFSLNILNSNFIKGIVDAGTATLKFANSDLGKLSLSLTVAIGLIKAIAVAWTKLTAVETTGFMATSLKSAIQYLKKFRYLLATTGSLSLAFSQTFGANISKLKEQIIDAGSLLAKVLSGGFGAAASAAGIFGVAVAGAYAAMKIGNAISAKELKSAKDGYSKATKAVKENKSEIEKLTEKGSSLNKAEKARLEYLKLQTAQLEKQAKIKRDKVISAEIDTSNYVNPQGGNATTYGNHYASSEATRVKLLINKNKALAKEMENDGSKYDVNNDKIAKNNEEIQKSIDENKNLYNALKAKKDAGERLTSTEQEAYDALTDLNTAYEKNLKLTEESSKTTAQKSVESLKDAYTGFASSIEKAKKAATDFNSTLSSINDEGDALKSYGKSISTALKDAQGTVDGTKVFWKVAEEVLGKDFLESVDYNFGKVQAKLQDIQKTASSTKAGTGAFYDLLYSKADALKKENVEVKKTANGITFKGITTGNLDKVAKTLGVSKNYLRAMIDSAQKFSDINLFDPKEVEHAVTSIAKGGKNAGIQWDKSKKKVYAYASSIKEAAGVSDKDWKKFKKTLSDTNVKMVDFDDITKDTVSNLLGMSSAFGKTKGGKTVLNYKNIATQLKKLGYNADQAKTILGKLGKVKNVKFNVDEKTATKQFNKIYNKSTDTKKKTEKNKTTIKLDDTKAIKTLDDFKSELNKLDGKTATTYVTTKKKTIFTGNIADKKAKGGEAKGGNTLVGEEAPELVQSGDRAYVVGMNGAEIVRLKKGDRVFNGKDTKNILAGKHVSGAIASRASGSFKGSSGSSSSSSSSKSKSSSSKSRSSSSSSSSKSKSKKAKYSDSALEKFKNALEKFSSNAYAKYMNNIIDLTLSKVGKSGVSYYKSFERNANNYYKSIQSKARKY